MKARLSCFVLAALLEAGSLAAQLSCPATVSVIAFSGNRTETLTVNDFRATTKGYEISIRAVDLPPAARRILFVLDRSGSMTSSKLLTDQAVGEALSAVPVDNTVAFLVFAGQYSKQTDFMNLESLKERLPDILTWKPGSKSKGPDTPLWDNIGRALQMLTPHRPGDVIFVISDGDNNLGKLSFKEVQDELGKAGVPVLAFIKSDPYAATPQEKVGPTFLNVFAKATGGWVSQMQGQSNRPGQMILQLEHQYILELEVTPNPGSMKPAQKIQKWQLSLKSPEFRRRITLSYPSSLYPCAATP
jgi:hypothetical protein